MTLKCVLVTGDVVLDCHLYGGTKAAATALGSLGTQYRANLGGSMLTYELLSAAATAVEKPTYAPCLLFDKAGLEDSLPSHLRSYGVWVDQPLEKGKNDKRVWRVERHFGYGPDDEKRPGFKLSRNPESPPAAPDLTILDDGAIIFRRRDSSDVWPDLSPGSTGEYLLKMSSPLCRGDLWAALEAVYDRLTIVVSAGDLRREDAQINGTLSWEQCAEHAIAALEKDPLLRHLRKALRVIVSFGSAGALLYERGVDNTSNYHLVFESTMLEGDFGRKFDGTTYGFQTCLTAAVAHHLMHYKADEESGQFATPDAKRSGLATAIRRGIASGLKARKKSLELGHGEVGAKDKPGYPIKAVAETIAKASGGFTTVEVPPGAWRPGGCRWTILEQSETSGGTPDQPPRPLAGLAIMTARYGTDALSHVPALRLGRLFTVDRAEIESLRTLDRLIRNYEAIKVQKKPLSIGVFGPPGAGKSFGVEALAKSILGDKVPFLEFNLSQFTDPEELIGAFHRVRDAVLKGVTPVAFWDEFDSQQYKWLQYLLAPMQDGAFQQGEITHPIGKCIFVFAGGTAHTLDKFGVPPPTQPTNEEIAADSVGSRRRFDEAQTAYQRFVLLKGPDFISRLHGYLNVLGPNRREHGKCPDVTWPIRRALILRGIIGCDPHEALEIDPGLLKALLCVSKYKHGARSFEKILRTLMQDRGHGRLNRSALPPTPLLDLETDADEFRRLLTEGDDFKNHPDLEAIAAAIHFEYLDGAKQSEISARQSSTPELAWKIDPSIVEQYDLLEPDGKAANRAAAQRIPDLLSLIDFRLEPQSPDDHPWRPALEAAIVMHLDRLAQGEHLGWCAERRAAGWTHAIQRKNELKQHPSLVPWAKLCISDQDKDRNSVRRFPEVLQTARYKAVPTQ